MEDRDYLDRISVLPFALHDKIIAVSVNEMEPKSEKNLAADVTQQLRMLDNAINRVRRPRLDVGRCAEKTEIDRAHRSPAPNFSELIAA